MTLSIKKEKLAESGGRVTGWMVYLRAFIVINGVIFLATQRETNLRQTTEKIRPGKSVRNVMVDLNEHLFPLVYQQMVVVMKRSNEKRQKK